MNRRVNQYWIFFFILFFGKDAIFFKRNPPQMVKNSRNGTRKYTQKISISIEASHIINSVLSRIKYKRTARWHFERFGDPGFNVEWQTDVVVICFVLVVVFTLILPRSLLIKRASFFLSADYPTGRGRRGLNENVACLKCSGC